MDVNAFETPLVDWYSLSPFIVLLAGALVVPFALPYLRLRRSGVVPSYDVDFVARLSAPPWSYLASAGLRLVGPVAALVTVVRRLSNHRSSSASWLSATGAAE